MRKPSSARTSSSPPRVSITKFSVPSTLNEAKSQRGTPAVPPFAVGAATGALGSPNASALEAASTRRPRWPASPAATSASLRETTAPVASFVSSTTAVTKAAASTVASFLLIAAAIAVATFSAVSAEPTSDGVTEIETGARAPPTASVRPTVTVGTVVGRAADAVIRSARRRNEPPGSVKSLMPADSPVASVRKASRPSVAPAASQPDMPAVAIFAESSETRSAALAN